MWMLECSFGGSSSATVKYTGSAKTAVGVCSPLFHSDPHVRVYKWGLISSRRDRQHSPCLTFSSLTRRSPIVVARLEAASPKQQAHPAMDGQSSGPVLRVHTLTLPQITLPLLWKPSRMPKLHKQHAYVWDCCRMWCC